MNEGSGAYLKFRLKGRALIDGGARGGGGGGGRSMGGGGGGT